MPEDTKSFMGRTAVHKLAGTPETDAGNSRADSDDEMLIDKVLEDLTAATPAHDRLVTKLDEYDRIFNIEYEGVESITSYGRSMFAIPKVYGDVMGKVAKIWIAILGNQPFFKINPREESDIRSAEANQAKLEYDFQEADTDIETYKLIVNLVCYGWGVVNAYWRRERKVQYDYLDEEEGIKATALEKDVFNGPWFESQNLRFLYLDPRATSVKKSEFAIRRYVMSYRELQEKALDGKYINVDDIDLTKTSQYVEDIFDTESIEIYGKNKTIPYAEIVEEQTNDRFITIANRKTIIRNTPNPFHHGDKTYIDFVSKPIQGRLTGKGDIEPVVPLQHSLDTTHNQIQDHINFAVNPVPIVVNGYGIDKGSTVELRAGKPIFINDKNAIDWMRQPELPKDAYNMIGMLNEGIEHANGTYRYAMGKEPQRRETQGGISLIQQASSPRFEVEIKIAARTGFRDLVKRFAQLNWQFVKAKDIIPIIGKRGIFFPHLLANQLSATGNTQSKEFYFAEISPKDIRFKRMFDFKINVNPEVMGKDVKRQQLIMATQALQNFQELNRPKMIEAIIATFDVDDPDQFIIKPYDAKDPFENPEVENKLLFLEQWDEPDPKEDLQQHLQSHIRARNSVDYINASETGKRMLDQHIQITNVLATQMINQQMQMQMMAMANMQAGNGGMPPQGGGMPPGGMPPRGMPPGMPPRPPQQPPMINQGPGALRPIMAGANRVGFRTPGQGEMRTGGGFGR